MNEKTTCIACGAERKWGEGCCPDCKDQAAVLIANHEAGITPVGMQSVGAETDDRQMAFVF